MRALGTGVITLFLLAFNTASGAADPYTPRRAMEVRYPGHPSISPDGRLIAFDLQSLDFEKNRAVKHLYVVPLGGGPMRLLTHTGTNNGSPSWSPDGTRIAFVSTRKGKQQIYVFDLARGGDARQLTKLATGASGPIWSPDGKHIAFVSSVFPECKTDKCNAGRLEKKKKNKVKARVYDDLLYRHWSGWDEGRRSHIFVMRADGGKPRDLTPGAHHAPTEILNAGRGYAFAGNNHVIFASNRDRDRALSTNNDLFSIPLQGGRPRQLTTNKAWDANPVVSPSGRYLAYLAYERPGFEADRAVLVVRDRTTAREQRRSASFDRSVREIAWFPDESGMYLSAYNRGYREIYSVGRDAGEVAPVLTRKSAWSLSVGPNRRIAFVSAELERAPEIHVFDPKTRKTRRVTEVNTALMKKLQVGKAQSVDVLASDKTTVQGFVVYPPGFSPKKRYPLVVLAHGGPQGAFTDTWHPRWNPQLFAAKGFVVAMPNFRGSVGYGQKYTDAVTKNWGGEPYTDFMSYTEALAKKPYIDQNRICAGGASFGGYLVNWIAGHTTRFKCLISHAGLYNLESFWGDTEELWFPEWEFNGPPWSKDALYDRWSPHRYIQRAKTPTLVIHGQLDYRVHLSQGQQLFTALKRLGVPARFVYFPDEGHWIKKPQNFVFWYGEMLAWLEKHLK